MASVGAWILAAALLLGGCVGHTEERSLCVRTDTPVPADEGTRFGFSGDQLLALVEGTHMAQLTWDAYGLDPSFVTTNAIPGETTISVRVARSGEVRVVEQEPRTPGSPCPDGVEADVEVEAVSADGALAELARGVVFAESSDLATLYVPLQRPPMGTLRIDASPSIGLRFSSLSLSMGFVPGSFYGDLILILGNGTNSPDTLTLLYPARLSPLP